MIRLDKFLCEMELGTRSQVKEMIKKGMILVDDEIIKKADYKFDENNNKVYVTYEIGEEEGMISQEYYDASKENF